MADKNIQMQKKRSDGGFDNYFPITKAANVKTTDNKNLQTLITAKVDKPTSATSGNIAVFDGGAGRIKDGGLSLTQLMRRYNDTGYTEQAFETLDPPFTMSPDITINTGKVRSEVMLIFNNAYNPDEGGPIVLSLQPGANGSAISISRSYSYNYEPRFVYAEPEEVKYSNDIFLGYYGDTKNASIYGQLLTNGTIRLYVRASGTKAVTPTIRVRWFA